MNRGRLVEWVLQGGPRLLPRQVSTCRPLGRPRRSCCHAEKGKGRQGKARDGREGMGWDGIMGSSRAQGRAGQGRAGQGRACLQRTAPASSCHTNPRKQQTTSQLGCTSPIPRCNGFPGHDAIRCCRCRVLSSHLYSCGSSNGSRSMQPMCKGPCGLEDTAEQSKVSCRPPFLTPPSPLSALPYT